VKRRGSIIQPENNNKKLIYDLVHNCGDVCGQVVGSIQTRGKKYIKHAQEIKELLLKVFSKSKKK